MEKLKEFLSSPLPRSIFSTGLAIIGGVAIIAIIFFAGEVVGFDRAQFSGRLADNYNRIFVGHMSGTGMMNALFDNDVLENSHGAAGTIINATLPNIVVLDRDGTEKTITITPQTIIRQFRNGTASTSLSNGESITVLGEPKNDGSITAAFIRIMPTFSTTTTTTIQ